MTTMGNEMVARGWERAAIEASLDVTCRMPAREQAGKHAQAAERFGVAAGLYRVAGMLASALACEQDAAWHSRQAQYSARVAEKVGA